MMLSVDKNLEHERFIKKFIGGLNRTMESKAYIWFACFQKKNKKVTWNEFIVAFWETCCYEIRKAKEDE